MSFDRLPIYLDVLYIQGKGKLKDKLRRFLQLYRKTALLCHTLICGLKYGAALKVDHKENMGTDILCLNFSVRMRGLCLVHNHFFRKKKKKRHTFPRIPRSYSVVVFTDPVQSKIPISAFLWTAI